MAVCYHYVDQLQLALMICDVVDMLVRVFFTRCRLEADQDWYSCILSEVYVVPVL